MIDKVLDSVWAPVMAMMLFLVLLVGGAVWWQHHDSTSFKKKCDAVNGHVMDKRQYKSTLHLCLTDDGRLIDVK